MADIIVNGQVEYGIEKLEVQKVGGGTETFGQGGGNPYENILDNQTSGNKGAYLFSRCQDDDTAFVNHFTSSVKNKIQTIQGMFYGCSNLTSLDLTDLPTIAGNVVFSYLFANDSNLTSINFGKFLTYTMSSSSYMFNGCSGLTTIDLSSQAVGTGSAIRDNMFYNCTSLTSLTLPSGDSYFNCGQSCQQMFANCKLLTHIDLSNCAFINVRSFYRMFAGTSSANTMALQTITFSERTVIGDNSNISQMFQRCVNLTTINYLGTKDNWKTYIAPYATLFDGNGLSQPTITVQCTDGQLIYNNNGDGTFNITEISGGDTEETTEYIFDGNIDYSSMLNGFVQESVRPDCVGHANATITVPVTGKCYIDVYGYYSGTAEIQAGSQGEGIMFFNNGTTVSDIVNTYVVYDENATEAILTAKETTYITKIVVRNDETIYEIQVTGINISANPDDEIVGVEYPVYANVTNIDATNKSIKWSSSDENIATINEYTGITNFLSAGEVILTATACDGSGVSASITCNPKETLSIGEWYTTDTNLSEEEGALGISQFNTNNSGYKRLTQARTFTNLSGETITTEYGLKLNSSGLLSVYAPKANFILTVLVPENGQMVATPAVTCESINAEVVSVTTDTETHITTYVYKLSEIGTWNISRGDMSKENNPIIYAKCEPAIEPIDSNTLVTFKGNSFMPTGTEPVTILNHNYEPSVTSTDEVTYDSITYNGCISNGENNWLRFNLDGTIKFNVTSACTLKVYYFNGQSYKANVDLDGTIISTTTPTEGAGSETAFEYNIPNSGMVTITATSNTYLGAFEIVYN